MKRRGQVYTLDTYRKDVLINPLPPRPLHQLNGIPPADLSEWVGVFKELENFLDVCGLCTTVLPVNAQLSRV